jgi:hypothetical protein
MPGNSNVVGRARETFAAAASIHSQSVWLPGPKVRLLPPSPSPWGHLDAIHPGGVQRGRDPPDGLDVDPVPHGAHAVPQGHVLHEEAGHDAAIRSATRSAADVMMSRLPA